MNQDMRQGILLVGDLHRRVDIQKIEEPALRESLGANYPPKFLLCLGDWGVIWSSTPTSIAEEERLIEWYDKQPWETLVVLGNHEGYDRIEQLPVIQRFGGPVYQVSDKISILQNGNIYVIEGKNFFVFGGGDSVDKNRRIIGESWWPQEIPTREQFQRGLQALRSVEGVVDYVVSHTCPMNVIEHMEDLDILVHRLKAVDPTVLMLTELWRELKEFKGWYFGHFHVDFEWKRFRGLYDRLFMIK